MLLNGSTESDKSLLEHGGQIARGLTLVRFTDDALRESLVFHVSNSGTRSAFYATDGAKTFMIQLYPFPFET
jgi:hypothetical protein